MEHLALSHRRREVSRVASRWHCGSHCVRLWAIHKKLRPPGPSGKQSQALELLPLERDDEEFHTLNAPVRVTKRGVEQRLLIGNGVVVTRRDATLVQAIARAYAWFEDIRTGRIADLTQLAIREQLPRSYVQAHIPLACLAPRIIHAILEGRQPVDLTLKQLMYRTALSADWDTQCRQLQFAD